MNKRFAAFFLMIVMTCFTVPSTSFATLYSWSQTRVWANSESISQVDITSSISSNGFFEIGDIFSVDSQWYATVTNLQFSFTDAVGDTYSWNLSNISEPYEERLDPLGGVLGEPDIHLFSNNEVRFDAWGGADHNVYSFIGNPGFPIWRGEFSNINLYGTWTQQPTRVPEPSALLLVAAGFTGLALMRIFKRSMQ